MNSLLSSEVLRLSVPNLLLLYFCWLTPHLHFSPSFRHISANKILYLQYIFNSKYVMVIWCSNSNL